MKTIREIEYMEGVRTLVRVDFNVPVKNGRVTEDFRLKAVLPTVDFLREKGAKVILISHLETNDGENISLRPVADHLNKIGLPVKFIANLNNAYETIEKDCRNGEVVLLENLRFEDGEKENDVKFAKQLASLGDIFVNEAFSVSHRKHASIVGIPRFLPSYVGLQFEKEVTNLSAAFEPKHPFLFIIAGAKFETKLPLIEKFKGLADKIFIGGALANDLFRIKDYEVGKSLVSKNTLDLDNYTKDQKIMIPEDVIDTQRKIWPKDRLPEDESIVDDGPKTLEILQTEIERASFILWNGPLGMYEDGFVDGTTQLAKMIGERTAKGGVVSIVGGGDTVAAIAKLDIADQFTFISTAGGAMVDFLAKGTLPGIEELK